MMKEAKSVVPVGKCLPLNKAHVLHTASDASVAEGKAVTVLTYLHGVKESQASLEAIMAEVGAARAQRRGRARAARRAARSRRARHSSAPRTRARARAPACPPQGCDVDLIELRSLKPLDMDTIRTSLQRTHKVVILDESTQTGGVGASVSSAINEQCFYELDAPVKRLCMDDAPVPYASSMECAVVKRGADLIDAVLNLVFLKG